MDNKVKLSCFTPVNVHLININITAYKSYSYIYFIKISKYFTEKWQKDTFAITLKQTFFLQSYLKAFYLLKRINYQSDYRRHVVDYVQQVSQQQFDHVDKRKALEMCISNTIQWALCS